MIAWNSSSLQYHYEATQTRTRTHSSSVKRRLPSGIRNTPRLPPRSRTSLIKMRFPVIIAALASLVSVRWPHHHRSSISD